MRVVVDLQGIQNDSRYRGIGRYSLSLIKALIRNKGHHEIIILLSGLFSDTIESVRSSLVDEGPSVTIRVWEGIGPTAFLDVSNNWRRKASQLIREAYIASLEPDALIVSSMFEGAGDDAVTSIGAFAQIPTAVILYDLIPLIYKNEYLTDQRVENWYREKLEYVKKADMWLAISESSREEGMHHLGLPAKRVVNISAAIEPEFCRRECSSEEVAGLYGKYNINCPFLMYSGAADPRKNIDKLIEAYASIPVAVRQSHQLVLAGRMPEHRSEFLSRYAKSLGLAPSEVIFTGHVTDDELRALYSLCKAYILPSIHEGFGLPALEAMACGAPTIGSNVSSIPEVIGLEAALFDPRSVRQMAEKITEVLTNESFRTSLIENARLQCAKFSWDKTAYAVLRNLESLHATPVLPGGGAPLDIGQILSHLISEIGAIKLPKPSESDLLDCAAAIAAMLPRDDLTPKIYLDISELHRRDLRTGIQRVVRSIAKILLEMPIASHQIELVYATESAPYRRASNFSKALLGEVSSLSDDIIDPREGDIFLGLDYQDQIVCNHAHYYDYLRQRGVHVCFVVYDLLPITLNKYFSDEVRLNFEKWIRVVTRQNSAICISRTVAGELSDWCAKNGIEGSLKIGWFHLGADIENSVPTRGFPEAFGRALEELKQRPTFLSIGTLEPRKGIAQILGAFELLWEQGIDSNLVIVGKQGWMVEALVNKIRFHPQLGDHLYWMESVSDEYLERLYGTATCLVVASEGEGFGLPLIEAARHKLPIIARDIPVFREVAGNQAFYFNGMAQNELAAAIVDWLKLYQQKAHPKSDTMPWLSWEESANQLLNAVPGMEKKK